MFTQKGLTGDAHPASGPAGADSQPGSKNRRRVFWAGLSLLGPVFSIPVAIASIWLTTLINHQPDLQGIGQAFVAGFVGLFPSMIIGAAIDCILLWTPPLRCRDPLTKWLSLAGLLVNGVSVLSLLAWFIHIKNTGITL